MVIIKNLTKKFGKNIVIENLTLKIEKYDKVTIFAPSGSGKTTLLNLILGIDNEYTGNIELLSKNYSVIYQEPLLFPYKTIKENIFYFLKLKKRFNIKKFKKVEDIISINEIKLHKNFYKISKNTNYTKIHSYPENAINKTNKSNWFINLKKLNQKNRNMDLNSLLSNNNINFDKKNITKLTRNTYNKFFRESNIIKCNCKKIFDDYKNWLKITELEKYENYYPFQISGGMKQKVAIIRAFLIDPDLILMDEPFKSIDFESKSKIIKFINKNYPNSTIVFTTHNIDEIPEITHKIFAFKKRPLTTPKIIKITSEMITCNNLLNIIQKKY